MADETDLTVTSTPRWHTIAGVISTVGWLFLVVGYCWFRWPAMTTLKPDAAATFLGGVFAPLALLWLIVGYIQQGVELRHSVEALRLQSVELRHSVEQQRQLVIATREQIELEKTLQEAADERARAAAAPILSLKQEGMRSDSASFYQEYVLRNRGKGCSDMTLVVEPYGSEIEIGVFSAGETRAFRLMTRRGDDAVDQLVTVTFRDELGSRGSIEFIVPAVEVRGSGVLFGPPQRV